MRVSRILVGGLFVVALIHLCDRAESAGHLDTLRVLPATPAQGQVVSVSTQGCGDQDYATGQTTALVGSAHFALTPSSGGGLVGRFTVSHDARPGPTGILVTCADGRQAQGEVTILDGGQAAPMPAAAAAAGSGGAVRTVNPAELVAGVGLLAVALGGGVLLAFRRRRENHRRQRWERP